MAFESRCLWSGPSSHQKCPLVDFAHLYCRHIIKFLSPFRASVFLTVIDRLNSSANRFGFFTTRLDLSAAILIPQFVNFLGQQKSKRPPLWGKTLICCGFKAEKPRIPKFAGDVREYAIFRSDFKDTIVSKNSKRGTITFLRACLLDKPLVLIKGIGSNNDAAWEYLGSVCADPRFVSDTITQDSKIQRLRTGRRRTSLRPSAFS